MTAFAMHAHRHFMTHTPACPPAEDESDKDRTGQTTRKPARPRRGSTTTRAHPFHAVAGLLSALLLLVGGCASLNVDSKDLVLAVKFDNDDWGEPDYSKYGYTEQGGGYHILLRMKLKGPEKGSVLSIRVKVRHYDAIAMRQQSIAQYSISESQRLKITPFKYSRRIGGRTAYGYSYFENDFKRWAQAWYVDCPNGCICEINLESPIDAKKLDLKLVKVLDHIQWLRKHADYQAY